VPDVNIGVYSLKIGESGIDIWLDSGRFFIFGRNVDAAEYRNELFNIFLLLVYYYSSNVCGFKKNEPATRKNIVLFPSN